MSYSEWNIDIARKQYFEGWAKRNNFEILNCTADDTPSLREYAKNVDGICVQDPRGLIGKIVIVKLKD